MNTAILTWATNTNNYGSILQAYALQGFLKEHNYNSVILDYSPLISDWHWPCILESYRRKVARKIKNITKYSNKNNEWKKQLNDCCKEYIYENLIVSEKYLGVEQLKSALNDFDTFICGSDQIWSMKRVINPVYYLYWVTGTKGKIAYAPSIPSGIIKNREIKELKKNTKGFTAISVREEIAAKELSELLNMDVVSTLDPTLLVDDVFWKNRTKSVDTDKYILCYFLGENDDYKKCVQEVKSQTGYNVKVIPFNNKSFEIDGEIQYGVGPIEFLDLIRNAEVVLTDSYHGSIFSIIFENNFVLFKRFIDGEKKDENGRIYDLTKKLKLEGQLWSASEFDYGNMEKPNYEIIKKYLLKQREKSRNFLLSALKRCEINE